MAMPLESAIRVRALSIVADWYDDHYGHQCTEHCHTLLNIATVDAYDLDAVADLTGQEIEDLSIWDLMHGVSSQLSDAIFEEAYLWLLS